MFIELGCLAAGIAPGRALRRNEKARKVTGKLTMLAIYALLFVMGAKLGADDSLFAALSTLGFQAIVIGLCCTMGSVLCVLPAQRLFRGEAGVNVKPQGGLMRGMLGSLYILSVFCLGVALARLGALPDFLYSGPASSWALWIMLVCVGMGIGFDLGALLIVRDMGLRVALVPLLAMGGTALGAVAAFLLLPMELRETLAVGAGFGYYSLASVVISNQGYVALGSIALLANITRELFTLLSTPLLARLLGPLAPVAAAGAPGMDTCLPVIARFTGEKYGIISIFNGLAMTILVPFLVPLAMLLFD